MSYKSHISRTISSLFIIISLSSVLGENYGAHLTISSVRRQTLELNWHSECASKLDQIRVFNVDPKSGDPKALVTIDPKSFPWGFYVTDLEIDVFNLPAGWNRNSTETLTEGPSCSGYWIGAYSANELVETDCLKIQPTWMRDNKDKLSGMPISKVLIPGTHNSGSFKLNKLRRDIISDFSLTQEVDVYTQLVYGIRYLDLRIGYYSKDKLNSSQDNQESSNETFWVNHDFIRIRPLRQFLQEVKDFVIKSTEEIVIVDIHRLPFGFYHPNNKPIESAHHELIKFIVDELGQYAIGYNQLKSSLSLGNVHLVNGPRMKDLWNSGKQIIICYADKQLYQKSDLLWPPLKQMWGDVNNEKKLKPYIQSVIDLPNIPVNSGNPLWAIMAELTPGPFDMFLNPKKNLRVMANLVNRNLTQWVEDDWWKKSNIYATDFFLGNNLIQVSINSIPFKSTVGSDDDKANSKFQSKC